MPIQNPPPESTSLNQKKLEIFKKIKRRLKTAKKTTQKIQKQLDDALNWKKQERKAIVLQANLYQVAPGTNKAIFNDWETGEAYTYLFQEKPHIVVSKLFKKSKKLERAIVPLQEQLQEVQKWQSSLEDALLLINEAEESDLQSLVEKFQLKKLHVKKKVELKKELPFKEFVSPAGILVWVGKNAKANDTLTFTYANGSDTWLHVSGYPGSHVVVKSSNPDPETLDFAIMLAIQHSKAKENDKVEVCITQAKYVSRYKSAKPGTVHISKHRKVLSQNQQL